VFYGWYIVAAGFLANIAYAEQFNATYGVFIQPVGAELGWSRTALAGVKTVSRIPEAAIAPFIGPLVDRYGSRWFIVVGGLIFGAGLMLASTIQEIWQLYLYMGILMPLGAAGLGGFVMTTTISNWFVSKRGRAVGIVGMGSFFSTMVLPPLASFIIENQGWRQAWFSMGVLALLLVIPAAVVVRRRPEDVGLTPDGVPPAEAQATPILTQAEQTRREELLAADVIWTRREILRTPLMWCMVFAWGFSGFALSATNLHMVPYFLDLGYPITMAAGAVTLRATMAFLGSGIWGYLLDRLPIKLAASIQFGLIASGLALWLLPPGIPTILAGLFLMGSGVSGTQVAAETIWAGFYGRLSLGTARGVSYPIQTVMASLGPIVFGLIYDLLGSYQGAFGFTAVGCVISALLVQIAPRPRRPARRPAMREP
jgi:MFS transporter, OFA family, oxalate/formate antiporter